MSIFKRVSVRDFTYEKVTKEQLQLILKAAMQAPSAVNQQPWEFLVCDDIEVLRKFSEKGKYFKSLKTAPLVLALYYRTNVGHPSFIMQDMAACAENCLLQVTDLDLGAVWMGIAPKEDRMNSVEEFFGKIENCRPFCLIAIGHPSTLPTQVSRYDESRIHYYKKDFERENNDF